MRWWSRLCAGGLAVLMLSLGSMPVASALPRPRKELYWFSWWELETKVWPITRGKGITVAMIDSRVNTELPDVKGAVLPNVNPKIKGVGVVPETTNAKDHGTGMAALIAGQGYGTGMVGVAPESKVLPIIDGGLGSGEIKEKIDYAVDQGADIINLSMGYETFLPCNEHVQRAISRAVEKDVVIVASAGNEGRLKDLYSWPASCPGVLAVGGLDGHVRPWQGTTPGEYVMIAAPAKDVTTINRHGRLLLGWLGTSSSAALVSGSIALVRSRFPDMPAREVVRRITATAKDVGPAGWDDVTGYGLVRPYRAIVDKIPANAPNPVYDRYDKWKAAQVASPEATNGAQQAAQPKSAAKNASGKTASSSWSIYAFLAVLGIVLAFVFGSSRRRKVFLAKIPNLRVRQGD